MLRKIISVLFLCLLLRHQLFPLSDEFSYYDVSGLQYNTLADKRQYTDTLEADTNVKYKLSNLSITYKKGRNVREEL